MGKMTTYFRALPLIPLVLAVALVAGRAAGEEVDAKGEKELAELGQKVDKTADRAAPEKVVDKIAGQFSGDKFACDNKFIQCGTSPLGTLKTLNSQQLENLVKILRTGSPSLATKGLGFGEISIALALAEKSGKSVNDILAMRQSGTGWGEVARKLGLKNLGSVVKSVKGTEKDVAEVARERSEKADKAGKAEKAEKMEKPEKMQRAERPEHPGRPGR